DAAGALLVRAGERTLRQLAPVAFQRGREGTSSVAASYRVEGTIARIALGPYDTTRPLVIDPVIAYATLLGGGADESVNGLGADRTGHAVATGYTFSADFPNNRTTKIPSEENLDSDIFVTKFAADGRSFVYSTIIGGAGMDQAASVAVDTAGVAYVAGRTDSADFPITTSASDATC